MKKILAWLKSPLGIGITTAILSPIISIIYDIFKDKPILSTMFNIIGVIYDFLMYILNFNIKTWHILIGITLILIIIYIIIKINKLKNFNDESINYIFLKYTKDSISNLNWEWNWEENYDGKYAIESLHPVCKNCSTPLVQGLNCLLKCPRCNYIERNKIPDFDHIKIIIYDNVKRKLHNT